MRGNPCTAAAVAGVGLVGLARFLRAACLVDLRLWEQASTTSDAVTRNGRTGHVLRRKAKTRRKKNAVGLFFGLLNSFWPLYVFMRALLNSF